MFLFLHSKVWYYTIFINYCFIWWHTKQAITKTRCVASFMFIVQCCKFSPFPHNLFMITQLFNNIPLICTITFDHIPIIIVFLVGSLQHTQPSLLLSVAYGFGSNLRQSRIFTKQFVYYICKLDIVKNLIGINKTHTKVILLNSNDYFLVLL